MIQNLNLYTNESSGQSTQYSSEILLQLGKKAGLIAKQLGALPSIEKSSDNKMSHSLFSSVDSSSKEDKQSNNNNSNLDSNQNGEIGVGNSGTASKETIYKVFLALRTRESVFDDSKDHSNLDLYSDEILNSVYSFEGIEKMFTLDTKQKNAFRIIASSIAMRILNEHSDADGMLHDIMSPNEDNVNIKEWLKSFGADPNLIMYLAGQAGSGKTHTLSACIKFTENLYRALGLAFGPEKFKVTAMTGSAASNFPGGTTTHSTVKLNTATAKLSYDANWGSTIVVVIDEMSFLTFKDLRKLDMHLRILTGNRDKLYGGLKVIFAGDMFQLKPCSTNGKALYEDSNGQNDFYWKGCISRVVYLENDHRFKEDSPWGALLFRISRGTHSDEDIQKLNQRCFKNNPNLKAELKKYPNASFASYTNEERCSVGTAAFDTQVEAYCSKDDLIAPPENILIVEANIYLSNGKIYDNISHSRVVSWCADESIQKSSGTTRIDPALKLCSDCPLIINSNNNLDQNVGNGSLCFLKKVKLKENCTPYKKKYNGYWVRCVRASDVEFILLHKNHEGKKEKKPVVVKIQPVKTTVNIKLRNLGSTVMKSQKIEQLDVLSGSASTGHKLQGQSKDALIVVDWTYKIDNWIYVVLSRVRTMNGIFFMQPIDPEKIKPPNQQLIHHENFFHGKEKEQNRNFENLFEKEQLKTPTDYQHTINHSKIQQVVKKIVKKEQNTELININIQQNNKKQSIRKKC